MDTRILVSHGTVSQSGSFRRPFSIYSSPRLLRPGNRAAALRVPRGLDELQAGRHQDWVKPQQGCVANPNSPPGGPLQQQQQLQPEPPRPQGQPPLRPPRQRWLSASKVKSRHSCADVWKLVFGSMRADVLVSVSTLSSALDHMKAVASPATQEADLAATRALLHEATARLGEFDAWAMVAFIRCAAGFKGSLTPAGLAAWQAALLRPGVLAELSPQGVSNVMLSLGTLAEADARLAVGVQRPLVGRLFQHAAGLAGGWRGARFVAQDAANVLFGAALLRVLPSRAAARALFAAVGRAPCGLSHIGATQMLLACQKLVDLGATALPGSERLPPASNPYHIYYPGDALMGAILARAQELRQDLSSWSATQIVGACGALGYVPGFAVWDELLAVVASSGAQMKAAEASAVLMGCAKLGIHPGPEVFRACWLVVEREGPRDVRLVASTAWSLAVMEACDPPTWDKLTALMSSHAHSTDVSLRMFHHAYLLMKLRYGPAVPPGGTDGGSSVGPMPALPSLPPELLQSSLAAHRAGQLRPAAASQLQRALGAAVEQLAEGQGVGVEVEYTVEDPEGEGQLRVDVAVPSLRVVLEADGPHHFLRNSEGRRENGETRARNRLLRGWGWRVVGVPHTVWDKVFEAEERPSHERLDQELRCYLEQQAGLVEVLRSSDGADAAPAAAA